MKSKLRFVGAGAVVVLFASFIAPAYAADNPVKLVAPKEIVGIPAIPFTGLKAQAFSTPSNMVNLEVSPSQVVIGDALTITGKGLPGNIPVTLTWSTSDATWIADVQPNTVNYMGTSYTKYNVVIATISTDALGGFVYKTKVPSDFGGVHDIYAVNNNVAVAHGGLQVARTLTISPKSGPIGTPITITSQVLDLLCMQQVQLFITMESTQDPCRLGGLVEQRQQQSLQQVQLVSITFRQMKRLASLI